MSAQLTLTDLEMACIRKAIRELGAIAMSDAEAVTEAESAALMSADRKMQRGLNRPSVRVRPRA